MINIKEARDITNKSVEKQRRRAKQLIDISIDEKIRFTASKGIYYTIFNFTTIEGYQFAEEYKYQKVQELETNGYYVKFVSADTISINWK